MRWRKGRGDLFFIYLSLSLSFSFCCGSQSSVHILFDSSLKQSQVSSFYKSFMAVV